MINRLSEKDQVRMIIKNLQPEYLEKLEFQSIVTFEQLFDIGTRIQDAIRDGRIKRGHQMNKFDKSVCSKDDLVPGVNALTPQSFSN